MKKYAQLFVLVLVLVFAGCGATADEAGNEDIRSQSASQSTTEGSDSEQTDEAATSDSEADDADEEPDTPFQRREAIGMTFAWRVVGDTLEVELTGPTTGWIAVGFNPSSAMLDADIHIGYVTGSEVVLSDEWGTTMRSHRPDSELGGIDDGEVISGSESDGSTTIAFPIPLASGDEYDHALSAGSTIPVILAYGQNGGDDTTSYHANRAGIEITL